MTTANFGNSNIHWTGLPVSPSSRELTLFLNPAERCAEAALVTWQKNKLSFWIWTLTCSLTIYASFSLNASVAGTGLAIGVAGLIAALLGLGFELCSYQTQLKWINALHSVSTYSALACTCILAVRTADTSCETHLKHHSHHCEQACILHVCESSTCSLYVHCCLAHHFSNPHCPCR